MRTSKTTANLKIKIKSGRQKNKKEYTFEFSNSENLTNCILMLYKKRSTRKVESSLYKINNCYRLIIKSAQPFFNICSIGEFCMRTHFSPIEIAYTKEHGKKLIDMCAVEIYGKAFSKCFDCSDF